MQKDKKYVNVLAFCVSVAPGRHKRSNIDAAQVPDEICQDLADEISKDWKKLGRRLSISAAALDNIDHENPSVWEKSIAMLNKWRENCGEEAIMKVLTEALKKIRRKDLSGTNICIFPFRSSLLIPQLLVENTNVIGEIEIQMEMKCST